MRAETVLLDDTNQISRVQNELQCTRTRPKTDFLVSDWSCFKTNGLAHHCMETWCCYGKYTWPTDCAAYVHLGIRQICGVLFKPILPVSVQ